jgi:hypothetical protein
MCMMCTYMQIILYVCKMYWYVHDVHVHAKNLVRAQDVLVCACYVRAQDVLMSHNVILCYFKMYLII